jgi:hypothetical protein
MGGSNTTTTGPTPDIKKYWTDLLARAQNVSNTPYKPYGGQLVAPFSGLQKAAFGAAPGVFTAGQPYMGQAAGFAQAAAAPVNATAVDPTAWSGAQVSQYMNPYQSQVVNATMANMNEMNAQQQQQLISNPGSMGAFGGDRMAVAQAELARQQGLAGGQTLAGLNQANYQQAQQEFNQQQGVGLQAGQFNAAQNLQAQEANRQNSIYAAGLMGNLSNMAQQQYLAGVNTENQLGSEQMQRQQAVDQSRYQQWLNQRAYPFQTTQFMSNILQGVGPSAGTQTTQPSPNPLSQGLGLGMGMLNFLFPGMERGGGIDTAYARGGGVKGYAIGGPPYAIDPDQPDPDYAGDAAFNISASGAQDLTGTGAGVAPAGSVVPSRTAATAEALKTAAPSRQTTSTADPSVAPPPPGLAYAGSQLTQAEADAANQRLTSGALGMPRGSLGAFAAGLLGPSPFFGVNAGAGLTNMLNYQQAQREYALKAAEIAQTGSYQQGTLGVQGYEAQTQRQQQEATAAYQKQLAESRFLSVIAPPGGFYTVIDSRTGEARPTKIPVMPNLSGTGMVPIGQVGPQSDAGDGAGSTVSPVVPTEQQAADENEALNTITTKVAPNAMAAAAPSASTRSPAAAAAAVPKNVEAGTVAPAGSVRSGPVSPATAAAAMPPAARASAMPRLPAGTAGTFAPALNPIMMAAAQQAGRQPVATASANANAPVTESAPPTAAAPATPVQRMAGYQGPFLPGQTADARPASPTGPDAAPTAAPTAVNRALAGAAQATGDDLDAKVVNHLVHQQGHPNSLTVASGPSLAAAKQNAQPYDPAAAAKAPPGAVFRLPNGVLVQKFQTTRPLIDPAERVAAGIDPNDHTPYQVDLSGKITPINPRPPTFEPAATAESGRLAAQYRGKIADEAAAERSKLVEINELQSLMGHAYTGAWGEDVQDINKKIQAVLSAFGVDSKQLDQNVAAAEGIQKFGTLFAAEGAKADVGARVTNFDFNQFLKVNGGLLTSPDGFKRLVGIFEQQQRIRSQAADYALQSETSGEDVSKWGPKYLQTLRTPIVDPLTGVQLNTDSVIAPLPKYQTKADVRKAWEAHDPNLVQNQGWFINGNGDMTLYHPDTGPK